MNLLRSTITDSWLRRVQDTWGTGDHLHTLEGCRDLVHHLVAMPSESASVIAELARRCALDGYELHDVQGWIVALADALPRRSRRAVLGRHGAVAASGGWAEGVLERRHVEEAGLAGTTALAHRLADHYRQCSTLGLDPADEAVLVVLDADTAGFGPHARAGALDTLAEIARASFPGATLYATHRGRLLLFVPRVGDLATRVATAVFEAQSAPLLAGCNVRGWVEPISPDERLATDHLDDLVRSY